MWNPLLFFTINKFQGTQNNFNPLNNHTIKEISWAVTMVTGHAQHCHIAVTCPIRVATVNTIAVAGLFAMSGHTNSFFRAL